MVTIPRYQSRVGVPLRGQEFAKQFGPGAGEGFRDIAQIAAAADTVIDGARTLWDLNKAKGAEQRREVDDQQASLEADEQEINLRANQLGRGDQGRPLDSAAIALAVRQAAEGLSPAARTIFERRIAPREATWHAQARASAIELTQARREAVAVQREILGVEEYVRHADVDETLGRLALASAVAQRGERLAAAGFAADAVRAGKQALLAQAETLRIQRAIGENPEKAAGLLATRGKVLAPPERDALAREIAAEQVRVEAAGVFAKIAGQKADLADNLEGLTAEVEAIAGEDPARRAAYHSAAVGVWRGAKAAREAAEEAGWQAVAPLLEAQSGVRSWTEVPGPIWAALSGRQREMVKAWLDDPGRGSDPEILAWAGELARNDARGLGEIDLTALGSRLTPPDHTALRGLQQSARQGGEAWANDRARWLAERGEAEAPLLQQAAWKRGDAAPPASLVAGAWQPSDRQTYLSRRDRAVNIELGKIDAGDGLFVNPDTGQVMRFRSSGRFQPDLTAGPEESEVVTNWEAQQFRERRLGVASYQAGVRSEKEAAYRAKNFATLEDAPRKEADQRAPAQFIDMKRPLLATFGSNRYILEPGDENLLARMIYAEGGYSYQDFAALAWATMNRVGVTFRKSLYDVLVEPNGFQIVREGGGTVDNPMWVLSGTPERMNLEQAQRWERAKIVARGVLSGQILDETQGANHFFASRTFDGRRETAMGGFRNPVMWSRLTPSPYRSRTPEIDKNYFFSGQLAPKRPRAPPPRSREELLGPPKP